jgi:transposase InsO family protein
VIRVLEQLVELHGAPTTVKSDNEPEFVAKKIQEWIKDRGIGVRFIKPGSPWQNGHVVQRRFSRRLLEPLAL